MSESTTVNAEAENAGGTSESSDRRAPIVVGFDGSDSSRRALEWAAGQGKLTGEPVELLASWSMPKNYGYAVAFESTVDLAEDTRTLVDEAIAAAQAAHPGVEFQAKIVEGEPRSTLVTRSKIASMLVVGSRGHGELTGMLLGSVSGYCVTHAACPVLVVRG